MRPSLSQRLSFPALTAFFAFSTFCSSALVSSCAPFAGEGDSCLEAPCAAGLLCVDGTCETPPPPPPPPCTEDGECRLDGDASGRECVDGECRFAACTFDAQCGTRICVDGTCAQRIPCLGDDDCDDGDLCTDNVCRAPCGGDDDCGLSVGGISLNACVEGRCLQRCFNDATCFGQGICEDGICVEPSCDADEDCGSATQRCDAGRCADFVPCAVDDECFDANLFCATDVEPARCQERPLCNSDAACGLDGICLDGHCRPSERCVVDDDCVDSDDECVGGRCVRQPACRQNADCGGDQQCVNLRCLPAPEPTTPAAIVVSDALGVCDGCTRTWFVGERIPLRVAVIDEAGVPTRAPLTITTTDPQVAVAAGGGVSFQVEATGPGIADVVVTSGALSLRFTARVVAAATDGLQVLVVDAGEGVVNADVDVDGLVRRTDANGVAVFAAGEVPTDTLAVIAQRDTRVVAGLRSDATVHQLRLPLPSLGDAGASADSAPLNVTVTSTGDELGPVGIGVAVPATSRARAAGLRQITDDVVAAAIEIPVLGAVPVTLPSAMTLEATLTLVGQQSIRPAAEVRTVLGAAMGLALEGRREQQDLIQIALGGDATALALDLLDDVEGLDATLFVGPMVEKRLPVADAADRDGDGDTAELVPDFPNAPTVDVRPSLPPLERSGVLVSFDNLDGVAGGGAAAYVVAGYHLPDRFVPAGLGRLRGLVDEDGAPVPESFKAVPAAAPVADFPRVIVVHGVDLDDAASSALVEVDALPAQLTLPALLPIPDDAVLLPNIPAPGVTTFASGASASADVVRLRLTRDAATFDVWLEGGASVLPAALAGARLREVHLYGGLAQSPLAPGIGPVDVDDSAPLHAFAIP